MGDGTDVTAEDPFYKDAYWSLKFAWLPHRCDITGEEIWFKMAYRGISRSVAPSGVMLYSRWIKRDEWLVEKLKGTI